MPTLPLLRAGPGSRFCRGLWDPKGVLVRRAYRVGVRVFAYVPVSVPGQPNNRRVVPDAVKPPFAGPSAVVASDLDPRPKIARLGCCVFCGATEKLVPMLERPAASIPFISVPKRTIWEWPMIGFARGELGVDDD
jgi:hypothetical protein